MDLTGRGSRSAPAAEGLTGRLRVSVIVPVHHSGDAFTRCLQAARAAKAEDDELIVVADGAVAEDEEIARAFDARILVLPRRSGPAAARNRAAAVATGQILLFVDADVALHPDAIEQIRIAFGEEPDIAALIGSYDGEPPHRNFATRYKTLLNHYVHQHTAHDGFTFWGACGAIRREAFDAVGGFDENYPRPSVEDIELGYRLKRAGRRVIVRPDVLATHLKRWTLLTQFRSDLCDRAIPWTRLILQYRRMNDGLNIDRASRLKTLLAVTAVITAPMALWNAWSVLVTGLLIAVILLMDRRLIGLMHRYGGFGFAARAACWHLVYYLVCAAGFGLGVALALLEAVGLRRWAPAGAPKPALEGLGVESTDA